MKDFCRIAYPGEDMPAFPAVGQQSLNGVESMRVITSSEPKYDLPIRSFALNLVLTAVFSGCEIGNATSLTAYLSIDIGNIHADDIRQTGSKHRIKRQFNVYRQRRMGDILLLLEKGKPGRA